MPSRPPTFSSSPSAQRGDAFELLGVAAHDPRQAARPGGEGRVALLRVRAAIGAVVHIEDALVRDAAAHVVGVAALAVIDGPLRGGARVLDEPAQQRNLLVAFAHEHVAELCAKRQRAQRADGVGEERMRAVEGMDEAFAVRDVRPARGLHGAGTFQRQFVEIALALVLRRCGLRASAARDFRRWRRC